MITQIDHIEIIVRDAKEYVEFYQKLGFKLLTWTEHHGGSAELQLPGPNQPILEIHTVLGEENIGVNHIAFKCDDAFETYGEMQKKDVKFDTEPYRNRQTGRTNIRLRDPDGWRLQICDAKRKEPEKGVSEDEVVEKLTK
jgi:catechol 2,3-dioxygenase-like lactoylglutathione lyase family enzyme